MSVQSKTRKTAPVDSVNFTNKPEIVAAIKEIARLKELERLGAEAEAERKRIEAEIIRPAMAGVTQGIVRGVVAIRERSNSNSKIDRELLVAGWPEAFEATLVTTPYTYFQYNLPV